MDDGIGGEGNCGEIAGEVGSEGRRSSSTQVEDGAVHAAGIERGILLAKRICEGLRDVARRWLSVPHTSSVQDDRDVRNFGLHHHSSMESTPYVLLICLFPKPRPLKPFIFSKNAPRSIVFTTIHPLGKV